MAGSPLRTKVLTSVQLTRDASIRTTLTLMRTRKLVRRQSGGAVDTVLTSQQLRKLAKYLQLCDQSAAMPVRDCELELPIKQPYTNPRTSRQFKLQNESRIANATRSTGFL